MNNLETFILNVGGFLLNDAVKINSKINCHSLEISTNAAKEGHRILSSVKRMEEFRKTNRNLKIVLSCILNNGLDSKINSLTAFELVSKQRKIVVTSDKSNNG